MKIHFGHINNSLGTRVLGEKTRLEIEASLRNGDFVTFDFDGVDLISHSFADECFGKLLLTWNLEEIQKLSTFKNTNDLVKKTIAFVIKERVSQVELT